MSNLFIPPGCTNLKDAPIDPQVRLGIQGAPNTGKTWSALTAPNPISLNFDRGLGSHAGREDVIDVKFYDEAYVDTLIGRTKPTAEGYLLRPGAVAPPNRRDALLIWLAKYGTKLVKEQTLVADSLGDIEAAFQTEYDLVPPVTDGGKYDARATWLDRIPYYDNVFSYFKSFSCNVILLSHEVVDRNDKGDLNGNIRTMLLGQYADKVAKHMTDFFRALVFEKPVGPEKRQKAMEFFGITSAKLDDWISRTPTDHKAMYIWQTQSDTFFKAKTGSLINPPKYIYADWKDFCLYRRKPISAATTAVK